MLSFPQWDGVTNLCHTKDKKVRFTLGVLKITGIDSMICGLKPDGNG